MPKPLAPSAGEINWFEQTLRSLRSYYDERNRTIHQLRRMRYMRLKNRTPRAYQKILARGRLASPLSYRLVQTATGLIAKERPRFQRLPIDKGDRDAASRLQQAADPLLQTLEYAAREPLYTLFVDGALGDGITHAKVERHPWAGFPIREAGEEEAAYNQRVAQFVMRGTDQPIRMRLVDPLNMLVSPDPYEPSHVIEQGKRPVMPVLRSLGLRFGKDKKVQVVKDGEQVAKTASYSELELPRGLASTVDVEELWTPDFMFVRIAGQVIKFENDLGFIPYVNTYGEVSSNMDPAVHSLSILYPYMGIEPWLNTLLGTLAAWSIMGSMPVMWTSREPFQGAPAPGEGAGALADIPLGRRIDLGTGGKAGFLEPPPVGREVLEFINLLVQFMDRAGITPLASGMMGTRTPGTAFDAAMEVALSKLGPLVANVERGLSEAIQLCWRMVDQVLKQRIWVTGIGLEKGRLGMGRKPKLGRYYIDPKDISGYYDLRCSLKTQSLQSVVSRGMHAAFMKAHGLWSRDHAMRFADVDDPWGEYLETLRDKIEEHPVVMEHIMQQALAEEPELAAMAEQLQMQGVDMGQLLAQGGLPGAEGGGGEGLYGGAPQPRGMPAPAAGGRARGSPKRPGGTRRGQGARFPK